ncbi:hypothetical protein MMC25_003231 [Agyrium rufum]|nr:hypothetical protein [Agyrium rufum]
MAGISDTPQQQQQPPSPSPRTSSMSLAASASINAGMHSQTQSDSRRSSISSNSARARHSPQLPRASERRISGNLVLAPFNEQSGKSNDSELGDHHRTSSGTAHGVLHGFGSPPSIGGSPTRTPSDPHHFRQPSIGELHQELEQEQEAQVNKLLQTISRQQAQIAILQQATGGYTPSVSTPGLHDINTPTSERSLSFSNQSAIAAPHASIPSAFPRIPSPAPRLPSDLSRRSSHRSQRLSDSRNGSPAIHPTSSAIFQGGASLGGEDWALPTGAVPTGKDEVAFYQAETQMLTRDNQMLKQRIRELEKQVQSHSAQVSSSPATPSNLGAKSESVNDSKAE